MAQFPFILLNGAAQFVETYSRSVPRRYRSST